MSDYVFTFNGYTFGGASAAVQILGVQGLEDAPAVRSSDEPRGFSDGTFYGRDFLAGRTIGVDLSFVTGSEAFRTIVEAAKAALVPQGGESTDALPLTFTLPGLAPRRVYCRLRRRSLPITLEYTFGVAKGAVEFYAGDPRIYDDQASMASISLAALPSGLTFNLAFNLSFGGAVQPNSASVVNAGTVSTKPVITIQGPVTNPVVQNATTGKSLRFNLTLAANDILTVDTDVRSVVLNGTASRRGTLSYDSVWWDLQPGQNTILFSADAVTAAVVQIIWRSAYL